MNLLVIFMYNLSMREHGFIVTPLFIISSAVLMLFFATALAAKTKSTVTIKEGSVGLVGYGTLMSLASLEQTLGHSYKGPAYQVHVRDYFRAWAYRRPNNDPQTSSAAAGKINACFLRDGERIPFEGMVNLNVYPERDARINCILYLVNEEDLAKIDKRERGYKRVDITDKVEEHDFSGGRVYIYEGLPEYADVSAADPQKYIIVKEYVNQVRQACDGIGEPFRVEFEQSTRPFAHPVVSFQMIVWNPSDK